MGEQIALELKIVEVNERSWNYVKVSCCENVSVLFAYDSKAIQRNHFLCVTPLLHYSNVAIYSRLLITQAWIQIEKNKVKNSLLNLSSKLIWN